MAQSAWGRRGLVDHGVPDLEGVGRSAARSRARSGLRVAACSFALMAAAWLCAWGFLVSGQTPLMVSAIGFCVGLLGLSLGLARYDYNERRRLGVIGRIP